MLGLARLTLDAALLFLGTTVLTSCGAPGALVRPVPDYGDASRVAVESAPPPPPTAAAVASASPDEPMKATALPDVDAPREFHAGDFGPLGVTFAVQGDVEQATRRVRALLVERSWASEEPPGDGDRVIVTTNLRLPDAGAKLRVVAIRFRINGGSGACSELSIGWIVQERGKRDNVWLREVEGAGAPRLVADVVRDMAASRCP